MIRATWHDYAAGHWPTVVLRGDDGQPTRAECPYCGLDGNVRRSADGHLSLAPHTGSLAGGCPGEGMPLGPTSPGAAPCTPPVGAAPATTNEGAACEGGATDSLQEGRQ